MAKDDAPLAPIRPAHQRREGLPLPSSPAGQSAGPAAGPSDYELPTSRGRPKASAAGVVKCRLSFPLATRMALERARLEEGMRPLSAIVNQAVVEYLRQTGIIVDV